MVSAVSVVTRGRTDLQSARAVAAIQHKDGKLSINYLAPKELEFMQL